MAGSTLYARQTRRRRPFRQWLLIAAFLALVIYAFWPELSLLWRVAQSFLDALLIDPVYLMPFGPQVFRAILVILVNLFGFVFLTGLMLLLVSQFVLPVETRNERRNIFTRLVDYLLGRHGLAVFVKNGRVVAQEAELTRLGRGVMLVDHVSAVVLEKQGPPNLSLPPGAAGQGLGERVRVEGPGIVFTRSDEILRGVADLRTQSRQRQQVHGYTRDGVQVRSDISITFTLGQPAEILLVAYQGEQEAANLRVVHLGERVISAFGRQHPQQIIRELADELDAQDKAEIHQFVQAYLGEHDEFADIPRVTSRASPTRFEFFPARVFAAIYSQAMDVGHESLMDWTELPGRVAAEVFRNMLSHQAYTHLYSAENEGVYPLQDFKQAFSRAVRNLGVLSYQFVGLRGSGGLALQEEAEWDPRELIFLPAQELKNPKVLRERGIKVNHAGFRELDPVDPAVRQQTLQRWKERLERTPQQISEENELHYLRLRNNARRQARREMTHALTMILAASEREAGLQAVRIFQLLETTARDSAVRRLLPADTQQKLQSLRGWFMLEEQQQSWERGRSSRRYRSSPGSDRPEEG
jgi:hypothetical protein